MKKSLLIVVCILSLLACQKDTSPVISGTAPGVFNGLRVYLKQSNENGTMMPIDTAVVMNESFDFGPVDGLQINERILLELDGSQGTLLFLAEEQPIELTLKKDSLIYSEVNGGIENKIFNKYRNLRIAEAVGFQKYRNRQKELLREANKSAYDALKESWAATKDSLYDQLNQLATLNPDRFVHPVITSYLYNVNYINPVDTRNLYNQWNDAQKALAVSQVLDDALKKIEMVAIGSPAPYFEGKNTEGKINKLPEVLNKVTLVDFWASWCEPCREENLNLAKAFNQYQDKGFTIVSVSLDLPTGKEDWEQAIIDDQMTWYHVSRLKHWSDPIASLYQVRSLPSNFLLDENGIIIDKNLYGNELQSRLKELLP